MLSYDNKLFDKTIKTKDTLAGPAFNACVCLRMFIGVMIVSGHLKKWHIVSLCSLIIFIFGSKYLSVGDSSWKCYNKVIISYLTILCMQFSSDKYVNRSAGLVAMMDALIGLNARCVISKLS